MKQEFENIRSTVECNEIDNLTLPLNMTLLPASAQKSCTEMFFDNDNLPVFLGHFPCLTSRTEHTSTSKTKREFCVEMLCLREVILLIRKRQQKPAFSQFDIDR